MKKLCNNGSKGFITKRKSFRRKEGHMSIDIEQLSEKELIDLNHRIIQRLKFLEDARANGEMMKFSVGDKVIFHPSGHEQKTGVLVKYNKKTVTVITDQGEHWNVAPSLLTKAESLFPKGNRSNNHNYN